MKLSPLLLSLSLFLASCRTEEAPARGGSEEAPVHEAIVSAGGVAPRPMRIDSLVNPNAPDSSTVAAGGQIFRAMNCDGCHGDGATGFMGPSLVDGRWRHGGSDGEVFQSIYFGRPRGMPAYGGIMNAGMIWNVVTYLKAQPVPANVPTEAWLLTLNPGGAASARP